MHIYIPTRGRAKDLFTKSTFALIPEMLHDRVSLVVHDSELDDYVHEMMKEYNDCHRLLLTAGDYDGIAEKRLWIGEHARKEGHDKFVMLDDDIDFLVRKADDDWRLRAASGIEAIDMFAELEYRLDEYAMVAISPREGNNRLGIGSQRDLVVENTRAMRILAFRTDDFLSVEHCRVPVMEDFDVTLQLLRSGRKNLVLGYWANGQKATNAPGGCSIWRTLELHNGAAERLAELHPQFVRTRIKENKTNNGGLERRTEVTVQWKRAFASSGA